VSASPERRPPSTPTRSRLALAVVSLGGAVLLPLASVAWLPGCGANPARAQCRSDADCGAGACMMGTCLPRSTGRTFAAEVIPLLDSSSAPTEIVDVAVGSDKLELMVEDEVPVPGVLVDPSMTDYAREGHLVAYVKSLIPGRSDLSIGADLAAADAPGAPSTFELPVRAGLIDTSARLWVFPPSKNTTQPPVPFTTVLTNPLPLQLPPFDHLIALGGTLLGPLDDPQVGYVARATVTDNPAAVISNAGTTSASGRFQLLFAPDAVPSGASIVVDLTPPLPAPPVVDNGLPHFLSDPLAFAGITSTSTLAFRMPAFANPAALVFTVRSSDTPTMHPVQDVTVRFKTVIPSPQGGGGQAVFIREKSTTVDGQVSVVLLPGTAAQARLYQVSATPPPDSPYATRCLSQVTVTTGGSDSDPQYAATILLDHKVELRGTVLGGDGLPAAGMGVTATRVSSLSDCDDTAALGPVSTTTARGGGYVMLLDPGVYALDLEPAPDAPYPRLVLDGSSAVSVGTDTNFDITLPAGEVVEGTVFDSKGDTVRSATVRFFEVLCAPDDCAGAHRVEPVERAETRTDSDGNFRTVLPAATM